MTDPTEGDVVRFWQSLLKGDRLESEDSSIIRVIYPGRRGDGHGPDFRDALIMRNGGTRRGTLKSTSGQAIGTATATTPTRPTTAWSSTWCGGTTPKRQRPCRTAGARRSSLCLGTQLGRRPPRKTCRIPGHSSHAAGRCNHSHLTPSARYWTKPEKNVSSRNQPGSDPPLCRRSPARRSTRG